MLIISWCIEKTHVESGVDLVFSGRIKAKLRLKYASPKNNNKIDPQLLRRFILELLKVIEQDNNGQLTEEFFVDYYAQNFDINDKNNFKNKGKTCRTI